MKLRTLAPLLTLALSLNVFGADGAVPPEHPKDREFIVRMIERLAVSKFLAGSTVDHLVGVGFLSRDELTLKEHGHVSSEGSAYHFPKTESSFWHDDFSGMFDRTE